ncbi:glycosyltransferase family 4 protein [Nocardia sp. alder85J]|uniref:glycosyltransferase family 4 protein n=1 Tax=Nocardia sp. alder85J TaxID=2862949 RepID=UPI001CD1D948|nr:glycosyltransferase family 4 protein [Nocardia sp. alder85J]MCX4093214.1 glycosyltransferase family 4 protein [Nocardia sp. alder85J]
MKAVFIAHTAAPSGAELATLRLASALRPHLDTAVVYTADGPMLARTRERGIETRLLANTFDSRAMTIAGAADPRRLLAGAAGLLRVGWALGATARELDATVLVAGSTKALLMGAVAARRAGVPLVWQVHDRITAQYFGRVLAPVIRLLGRCAAHGCIANSRGTLRTLFTWRQPAVVAYPGLEPAPETPRAAQREPEDTVVAVVGRLAPWKGQDLFLRALAAAKYRPRQVFLVGGTFFDEEPYRAGLEALATELALPVTFTGHVDDPEAVLREADVLVHCSILPEPFGQVVAEGMRAGCAVVATRPGGPTEIVESEVSGLLVDAGDEGQLTAALDRLLGDPALRTRLADAGRTRAAQFDITESARVVAQFLPSVRRKWLRHG